MNDIISYIGTGIIVVYSSTYSFSYNDFNPSSMIIGKENFKYSMPSKIIEHKFPNIIVKENKFHNDYENDAIEIPVVKKMRFKFNRPTKVEFV
jgi:hypothetical protein